MSANSTAISICGISLTVENGFEQNRACIVQPLRGPIIAHCRSLRIELFEGEVRLEYEKGEDVSSDWLAPLDLKRKFGIAQGGMYCPICLLGPAFLSGLDGG
jgi:hypothetical protein